MLAYLGDQASGRKLRLFAGTCCLALGDLIADPRCGRWLTTPERYGEGLASAEQLREAEELARTVYLRTLLGDAARATERAALAVLETTYRAADTVRHAATSVQEARGEAARPKARVGWRARDE